MRGFPNLFYFIYFLFFFLLYRGEFPPHPPPTADSWPPISFPLPTWFPTLCSDGETRADSRKRERGEERSPVIHGKKILPEYQRVFRAIACKIFFTYEKKKKQCGYRAAWLWKGPMIHGEEKKDPVIHGREEEKIEDPVIHGEEKKDPVLHGR